MSKKVEERVKGMWVWGSRLAVCEYVAQGSHLSRDWRARRGTTHIAAGSVFQLGGTARAKA